MRILLTRPREEAERSAARLAELGHAPLVAPLLEVVPTGAAAPAGPFDALLLTSANAVRAIPAGSPLAAKTAFAVGARTAAAAREAGFADTRTGAGDARALATLVAAALPPGGRLLHIAGRDRKSEPAASLATAGFRVATWVAYEARAVPRLPDLAVAALAAGTLDAALHYSRRSAALALALAEAAGLRGPFLALAHHCLSADVAAPLRTAGSGRLVVAPAPDEASLLASLSEAAVGSPVAGPGC